mmetsp:Transcript_4268/g.6248  ORF Transcript_4268/g.6248 Transcript_4268/m.6248 type:complete len:361 (-) Transcript_4268:379-1461(-)
MAGQKEWLDERFRHELEARKGNTAADDDSDCDSLFSVDSNDTLHNFIDFQSHRNSTGLEEAISFTYPFQDLLVSSTSASARGRGIETNENVVVAETETDTDGKAALHCTRKRISLSTLLEEDDLVPIFDGAGWAGTRVWSAAIWGIKYLVEEFGNHSSSSSSSTHNENNDGGSDSSKEQKKVLSLCELGCGLGVPGMIWHQMGGDVVLSDQERIMSQLRENVRNNFQGSYVSSSLTNNEKQIPSPRIHVQALDWSRLGFQELLSATNFDKGFDILLNCDCVYEPLYGKSWELLVEVIDECLKLNPKCCVVTSVERRNSDGIDDFVERMKSCDYVGSVSKVLEDKDRKLELYITKGTIQSN